MLFHEGRVATPQSIAMPSFRRGGARTALPGLCSIGPLKTGMTPWQGGAGGSSTAPTLLSRNRYRERVLLPRVRHRQGIAFVIVGGVLVLVGGAVFLIGMRTE
jgi:hypothetical protein